MVETLKGRRIILTGAPDHLDRGAGDLIHDLLRAGAFLYLWDSDPAALDALAARLGGTVAPMVVDLTKPDQVRGALAGAGNVDAIVTLEDSKLLQDMAGARPLTQDVPYMTADVLGDDPLARLISALSSQD